MADPAGTLPDGPSGESRRRFIRRMGSAVFGITLVDISDARQALAAGCGTGASPPQGEGDGFCSLLNEDQNCGIQQMPHPAVDNDQQCNTPGYSGTDPDQSCGDCDDFHQADQHCSKKDPQGNPDQDHLCGHQHNATTSTDQNCSATVTDVGCGVHKAEYNVPGTSTDTDQHCNPGAGQTDMTCEVSLEGDENCNAKANNSTTSPDEACLAPIDSDEACSHYDHDESCSSTSNDESCGTYKGGFKDTDENCSGPTDDESGKKNDGPIAPWCPNPQDADYYDPPAPPV